jgi:hypothetical protein
MGTISQDKTNSSVSAQDSVGKATNDISSISSNKTKTVSSKNATIEKRVIERVNNITNYGVLQAYYIADD